MKNIFSKNLIVAQSQLQVPSGAKGFVALFAVLITSIILALTIGLANTSYKESTLASSAKSGNYAFYAADSGIECGLYADALGVFDGSGMVFECAGVSPFVTPDIGFQAFRFEISSGSKDRCVEVRVKKNDPGTDGNNYTRIISEGYNVSCDDVDLLAGGTDLPHAVSRVIRVSYQEAPVVVP